MPKIIRVALAVLLSMSSLASADVRSEETFQCSNGKDYTVLIETENLASGEATHEMIAFHPEAYACQEEFLNLNQVEYSTDGIFVNVPFEQGR